VSEIKEQFEVGRYRGLGLLANPFALSDASSSFDAVDLEVGSESNQLLGAISAGASELAPKPIVVIKSEAMPAYYPLRAVGRVERSLATDESLGLLHAYVPMFMLRLGRVRATLQVVAERLAFRDFDRTLALYIETVLAETDEDLIAFQMLGADGLLSFAERFREDPLLVTREVFGSVVVERRPELTEVADTRPSDLVSDVEEEDASPELDATIGDGPGSEVVLAEAIDGIEEENPDQAVVDYIVEYTKMHLSPVIARALRVYRERGLAALTTELTITKAPRKTLSALIKFARVRFPKVILMWDGFEGWIQVPPETRYQIVGTLSELRWMLEQDALVVILLEENGVPELEEQFGSGTRIEWTFPGILPLEQAPDALDTEMVNRWLVLATAPGATPMTLADKVLAALAESAGGSLSAFGRRAALAVESAVERGVDSLDEQALSDAMAVDIAEAQAQ